MRSGGIEYVKKVAEDIRNMIVKGATTIAIRALESLKYMAEHTHTNDLKADLREAIGILKAARPTEPALFNGLIYVWNYFNERYVGSISEDSRTLIEGVESYLRMLRSAFEKIINFGSALITDGSVIITHCHSSTVSRILIEAWNSGKRIKVISTETRPVYQGRTTARELAEEGLEVIHVVDSAMGWAVKRFKPDLAIIGADALTSLGSIVNKIGSYLLAIVAKEHSIPLYIATTLLKMDTRTILGDRTEIEMRAPSEIWEDAPEGVEVYNPAFEFVPPEYITGIVSEAGIIPPGLVAYVFKEIYPEILKFNHMEELSI